LTKLVETTIVPVVAEKSIKTVTVRISMCCPSYQTKQLLSERLGQIETYLHKDELIKQVHDLEAQVAHAHFWDDGAHAQEVLKELGALKDELKQMDMGHALLDDLGCALELSSIEDGTQEPDADDDEMYLEAKRLCKRITRLLDELELNSWFDSDLDKGSAIVTIKPGQGGLEAQDWCEMLFHMYLHYCERKKWKVDVCDLPYAEVIGIDRATFRVDGAYAYGMLRAEQGVHRLVRISPTDAKKRRQTTFAGVEVLPVLPEAVEVTIDPQDLRIDVFHASGPGGQGVNTTDSAVRITHLPTNIVITCQNERSQLQNKAACMEILRSKLFDLEQQKRAEALDRIRGPKHDISWGNQIRNYILYPFQLVKDTRTQTETTQVDSVLQEGDLDQFIIAYHRWARAQRG
jgi:peptide chain release factor 2